MYVLLLNMRNFAKPAKYIHHTEFHVGASIYLTGSSWLNFNPKDNRSNGIVSLRVSSRKY